MTNENDCAYPADSQTQTEGGLTKREYFAGLAMQGLLAGGRLNPHDNTFYALANADALIKELNKEQP